MAVKSSTSRRKLLLGGLALGAIGGATMLRPKDQGAAHNDYFQRLSGALDRAQLAQPTLVVDQQALLHNIKNLNEHIGSDYHYRVVAKSLPSLPLLKTVMQGAQTQRLMMFHQPFLNQVAAELPDSDLLMGKPMPVQAAEKFYQAFKVDSGFDSTRQLQWLIDTPERLQQYQQLAQQLDVSLQMSIELDVGLHRGGVSSDEQLYSMLTLIEEDPNLNLSGFMGYEPHVAKLPGDKLAARDKAMAIYSQRLSAAEEICGRDLRGLTLNAAGSPTYRYYCGENRQSSFPHNELAAGSCLVKPLNFDLPSLVDHRPASFIASPVLKALDSTQLPGDFGVGKLMGLWNPNRRRTFFGYGGYWKAKPHSPVGLSYNPLFGRSTNQEMYNGSNSVPLQPDDWMFLRPTQSEFVFLQFGDIAVFDSEKSEIVDFWPVFSAT
ncbi:MAG: alanine racemase [Cellvibrionaceae bacterium]|nr:alanine racemase [Cellvibrionaceae bacterium]|tara:strand:- start:6381 stop:7682 length:1302 start_codon:yes stop_codon:yes gene_type:complete